MTWLIIKNIGSFGPSFASVLRAKLLARSLIENREFDSTLQIPGRYSPKFYLPRLRPEVQPLTLLHTTFDRKGVPVSCAFYWQMVPLSAVARLDLLGGGGNHDRRRRELLGGSGGMLPRKILNYRISEIAFSAFGENLFPAIFLCWSHKYNT